MAIKIIENYTNSLGTTIIKLECAKSEEQNIAKWCNEHQCGKQVARQRFAFKTEELTLFRMRWENT